MGNDSIRRELAMKVVVLTDMKMMLKKTKKNRGYGLVEKLEALPYDTLLPYDKNMAKRIKNLHEHVFDCDIKAEIDREIDELTEKISNAVGQLNRYGNRKSSKHH